MKSTRLFALIKIIIPLIFIVVLVNVLIIFIKPIKNFKITENSQKTRIEKSPKINKFIEFSTSSYLLQPSAPTYKIKDFDLITQNVGWVLRDRQLLLTTNGGNDWKDITPPLAPGSFIDAIFFLDSSNGWLMSSLKNRLTLWRTSNGGLTWSSLPFPESKPPDREVEGYVSIYFINPQIGWVVIFLPSSSNFIIGRLFKTTDGGNTWKELSTISGASILFITPDFGWVTHGPSGSELYVTYDGGTTWEAREIVPKENINGYIIYDLPMFKDTQRGLIPVIINDLDRNQTRVEFYLTKDGGHSWKLYKTVPISTEVTPNYRIPILIFDFDSWIIAEPNKFENVQTLTLSSPITDFDFVSPEIGWVSTFNRLLKTTDGGKTWAEVKLPNP